MQTPGILNLPVLFTSLWMTSVSASKALVISDLFFSQAAASASAMAPFDMAGLPLFIAFFMAFFITMVEMKLYVEALRCCGL